MTFDRRIFINCPFDQESEPLKEAMVFCCVYLGFEPLLATNSIDSGADRLKKILSMMKSSKYSIHDLSRCKSAKAGEYLRMNMPFEYGVDFAIRKMGSAKQKTKKFLVFEKQRYDLKKALSDIAGQDTEFHKANYELTIEKVRNFLHNEANAKAPGAAEIVARYATFQSWFLEKEDCRGSHGEKSSRPANQGAHS